METARQFRLNPSNARVRFSVRWFGVLRVHGWFADISGWIARPEHAGTIPSLSVQVEGASVRTGIGLRDRHLRGFRFLDSERNPAIRFDAQAVARHDGVWDVSGSLLLRGSTRPVRVTIPDDHRRIGDRRLVAEFTVPRRAHGIGVARGIRRLNPLLWAIADDVVIRVEVTVPATLLQPAAASVPSRQPASSTPPALP